MFKRNVGVLDRIVRVGLGLVLVPVGLILLGVLQGKVPGLVIAGLGGIGLITGITGFCPLYIPFGINTLEKEKELIDRFKSMAGAHMERCMSMMAGFRQASAARRVPRPEQDCGPCVPSAVETQNPRG